MEIESYDDLETKAGLASDAVVTHGEMMQVYETFRQANDERLAAIERHSADVLHDDKVERLSARIDELSLKQARPAFARDDKSAQTHGAREHKRAFDA
jgi:predicted phage gp36 major capsid-like protein